MPSLDPVSPGSPRRIVLIDFDWQDADLLPELLRHPGVDVRLVAGPSADDPGVRVAELCGVPRTLELADLARERFDLALLGERKTYRLSRSVGFAANCRRCSRFSATARHALERRRRGLANTCIFHPRLKGLERRTHDLSAAASDARRRNRGYSEMGTRRLQAKSHFLIARCEGAQWGLL